jgi:RNA polymerase sigma-70 factor, ECF subfamily
VQTTPPMTTTTALLDGLRGPTADPIWSAFDARYRPIIAGFVARLGLRPVEVAEVSQQTLADFVADVRAGRYERGKGRLRSWIIRIAQNRAMDVHRDHARRRVERGESGIVDIPAPAEAEEAWETERRRAILDQALLHLREGTRGSDRTLRAFELFALQQVPAETVAQQCEMTVHEVYVAKTRVTGRLRQIVASVTEAYDLED